MLTLILLMAIIVSAIMFTQTNHPLAMGLMLLIQTTLVSLMTGIISKSFWFSYILFLIFLGGMLVLFIYVTALASNEMFSMSMNMLLTCLGMMAATATVMMMTDMAPLQSVMQNTESTTMMEMKSLYWENSINLMKLYNPPTNNITLMLMNYLLITLIAVVKITNVFYGPLRKTY